MFPTSEGYNYVGIWAVALALIEILLIVPSAFGNSIIHKISSYKKLQKLDSLGYYLTFILWFGFVVLLNFILFKTQIINFIAGEKYLTKPGMIGSDFILPFLSVVLFLSFIKQVFNYVLVSFNEQNKLLKVNLI
jgi:O-antigen/teichoic acid export membrane protein